MLKLHMREAAAIHQHVTQLHQLQEHAEARLDKLTQHLAKAGHLTSQTQALLVKVWRNVSSPLEVPFGALEKLIPLPYRRTARGLGLSHIVLSTPELLEAILVNLSIPDLLAVMLVSQAFRDGVNNSPTIQRNMGLRPDPNCHMRFSLPFEHGLLRCTTDASSYSLIAPDDKLFVEIDLATKPRLGGRCRAILVCQPPLKSLGVYVDCCHTLHRVPQAQPLEVLTSETGITLGDIIDTTKRVKAAHRLCPQAETHLLDENGFVQAEVRFAAEVLVPEDEPLLAKKRSWIRREMVRQLELGARQARLAPYVVAKRAGMCVVSFSRRALC